MADNGEYAHIVIEEARLASAAAQGQAARLRLLALDIDRRRALVVGRADVPLARHNDAVWSSAAAAASREELVGVRRLLTTAGDALRATCRALEDEAERLERAASQALRAVEMAPGGSQATRSVSSTSLEG